MKISKRIPKDKSRNLFWQSVFNKDRKYQHIFQCPICVFEGKSDEEFKKHWKDKHSNNAGRGQAHRSMQAIHGLGDRTNYRFGFGHRFR